MLLLSGSYHHRDYPFRKFEGFNFVNLTINFLIFIHFLVEEVSIFKDAFKDYKYVYLIFIFYRSKR